MAKNFLENDIILTAIGHDLAPNGWKQLIKFEFKKKC
jgi:hypothetical protein